jgi:hypothetical protein
MDSVPYVADKTAHTIMSESGLSSVTSEWFRETLLGSFPNRLVSRVSLHQVPACHARGIPWAHVLLSFLFSGRQRDRSILPVPLEDITETSLIGYLQHHSRVVLPQSCSSISGCSNKKLGQICQIAGTRRGRGLLVRQSRCQKPECKGGKMAGSCYYSIRLKISPPAQHPSLEHDGKTVCFAAFLATWPTMGKRLRGTGLVGSKHLILQPFGSQPSSLE